jgi:hypothetical protein
MVADDQGLPLRGVKNFCCGRILLLHAETDLVSFGCDVARCSAKMSARSRRIESKN